MISSLAAVNIPVEDKSYKWSKEILKSLFGREILTDGNCSESLMITEVKNAIFLC